MRPLVLALSLLLAVPPATAADPPGVSAPEPASADQTAPGPVSPEPAVHAPGTPPVGGDLPSPETTQSPVPPADPGQGPAAPATPDVAPSSVGATDAPLPAAAQAPTPASPAPQADPIPERLTIPVAPVEPPPPPRLPLAPPPADLPIPLVVDAVHQDAPGTSPLVLPPTGPSSPGASSTRVDAALGPLRPPTGHADELRLHAGLTWEQCGPRRGVARGGQGLSPPLDPNIPVDIAADRADYDRGSEVINLEGGVAITQGTQHLEADRSSYDRKTGAVNATGNVYLDYPGARLQADTVDYNLQTRHGAMQGVRYRLSGSANLRGTAGTAELLPGELTRYHDVTYTTCPPGNYDWTIRARDLELNHPDGLGTARGAQLRFGEVPVFYTPYLRFPIDDRRRSGLLIPTIGSSNDTGLDLTLPYYWNIAPNLDATFYPRFMSTRGLMLGAQVRGLTSNQRAEIEGEILPHDDADPKAGARGGLRVTQTGTFGGHWATAIDVSSVSDAQFLADFGNRLDVTSQRNLSQRGSLSYSGQGYSVLTWLQNFQTVDPTLPPNDRPYTQLPHVELAVTPRRLGPAELAFDGRYDYFDHATKVHGSRGVLLPSLRFPLRRSYGFMIPRVRLFATGYELVETEPETPAQQSFLIPSLDLDTGLLFDRDTQWFGQGALQTLEPRLYYVRTPYDNQSDTPLFDTTELDFSFASLFRPNRFTGYDRIGDENRLTLGLTSRTLGNQSGREWLRVSLGQVLFFDPRRVQLTGVTVDETTTSSVAGELATNPTAGFIARASFQWDPNLAEDQWEKRVLQLRYAPGDDRVVNLAYRYNLGQTESERYENTDLSFRLPLTRQVGLVGRWLYSLLDNDTVDAFAGIEFGRCCWRLRILGRRLKTSADSVGNTSIMLQLELAGLGSLGNKIDKLLERGIYGYESD